MEQAQNRVQYWALVTAVFKTFGSAIRVSEPVRWF